MALRTVSIALLLWHLDALTIPLFEYRSSVFPLDVVVVECPRVGWHQIALESAGGPRLLGLVDAAPAPGARGGARACRRWRAAGCDGRRRRWRSPWPLGRFGRRGGGLRVV